MAIVDWKITTDVGNKAAVFPLQLLGFDVDVVNSVHFSNHTGYRNGFEGDILKGEQLRSILQGLKRNDLLSEIGHILTGYIWSESFLEAAVDVVKMVREEVGTVTSSSDSSRITEYPSSTKKGGVRLICDPVLGDKGEFYVPVELVRLYREKLIPLADVLTPNQFEAEQITGISIRSIDDAKRACHELHKMGPNLVVITSMELDVNKEKNTMTVLVSQFQQSSPGTVLETQEHVWRIDCPILSGQFTGTGDLCAALLLAHTSLSSQSPSVIPDAIERVVNTMFAILQRTSESVGETVKSRELKLIQSQDLILNPPKMFKAERLI
jgi:pyridoxine kinase